MPRGHKPQGGAAHSNAERQARWRARHAVAPLPVSRRSHKSAPRQPRPQRWRAAVAELLALQAEYAAWLDALPEPLRDSATGEVLQASISTSTSAGGDVDHVVEPILDRSRATRW